MKKLIFVLFWVLTPIIANAYDFEVDGIYYNILSTADKTVEVSYNPSDLYSGDIVIPEKVTYKGVEFDVVMFNALWVDDHYADYSPVINSLKLPKSIKRFGGLSRKGFSRFAYTVKKLVISDLEAWCNAEFTDEDGSFSGIHNPLSVSEEFYLNDQKIETLTIPSTISNIKTHAFIFAPINALIIPNTVKTLGYYCFANCDNLKNVYIPSSVEKIKSSFSELESLEEIEFEEGINLKELNGFWRCPKLKRIEIPSSVTSINIDAFSECHGLKKVVLPEFLENICEFRDCPNIETIESYIKEPFPIKSFDDVVKMFATLYVPVGTKAKYEATEGWKDFANIVESEELGTAIDNVKSADGTQTFFSIDGKQLQQPQRGLNIIRTGNGEAKKVLMK